MCKTITLLKRYSAKSVIQPHRDAEPCRCVIKMHFIIVVFKPVYQQLIQPCSLAPWLDVVTVNTSRAYD